MKKTALLTSLLMALGLSTSALAEQGYDNPGQAAPVPEAAPSTDFSENDLQKFADVQGDLEEIRSEYSGRLESTEDPDQAAQLQQEASQKMVQTVQDKGLNVETYSNIALAIQTDPKLRDKVQSMLN